MWFSQKWLSGVDPAVEPRTSYPQREAEQRLHGKRRKQQAVQKGLKGENTNALGNASVEAMDHVQTPVGRG